MENQILLPEELAIIQKMNTDLTRAKVGLGDLELQKHEALKAIDGLRNRFSEFEKTLIAKYGENAVINVQTGEVKQKE